MTAELSGQVAIVTGSGRGIGRAIGLALANAGARVAFVARTTSEIESAMDEAIDAGGAAVAVTADVASQASVEEMVAEVERAFGPIDLAVNNAGAHRALGLPWEIDPDEWWGEIEVNLKSAFLVSRFVLPGMVARGRGRIINIACGAAFDPRAISSAYATSKAAMLRLTDSTQAATAEHGVSVFAIHPGGVYTGLTEGVLGSEAGAKAYPHWKNNAWRDASAAANACVRIGSGEFDALAGRYLDVTKDLDASRAEAAAIVARDGLSMRLRP